MILLGPGRHLHDTFYWWLLDELATANHPAIVLNRQGEPPHQWQLALTGTGRRLLADELDRIALNGIDRSIGGIHLDSGKGTLWRAATG